MAVVRLWLTEVYLVPPDTKYLVPGTVCVLTCGTIKILDLGHNIHGIESVAMYLLVGSTVTGIFKYREIPVHCNSMYEHTYINTYI